MRNRNLITTVDQRRELNRRSGLVRSSWLEKSEVRVLWTRETRDRDLIWAIGSRRDLDRWLFREMRREVAKREIVIWSQSSIKGRAWTIDMAWQRMKSEFSKKRYRPLNYGGLWAIDLDYFGVSRVGSFKETHSRNSRYEKSWSTPLDCPLVTPIGHIDED